MHATLKWDHFQTSEYHGKNFTYNWLWQLFTSLSQYSGQEEVPRGLVTRALEQNSGKWTSVIHCVAGIHLLILIAFLAYKIGIIIYGNLSRANDKISKMDLRAFVTDNYYKMQEIIFTIYIEFNS